MNRIQKYLLRGLYTILGMLLFFWVAMYSFFLIKKESIRQQLSYEIGNAVKGEFKVEDLGMNFFNLFPNVSLSIKEVELKDSAWQSHQQSLLKAKAIFLRVNPFTLLTGNVRISKLAIEDAVINIFVDTLGYSNIHLLSPGNDSLKTNKKGFHLEEISIKNVRIIQSDQIKNKLYDLSFRKLKCELQVKGKSTELDIKLDGIIHSLGFNLAKGSYAREKQIKGNLTALFLQDKSQLNFEKIKLAIDRHLFIFSGHFDFNPSRDFDLSILTNGIKYEKAISLLPEKIREKLALYSIENPFDVIADIKGKMQFRNLPKVNISAKINPGLVKTPIGDFSETSFAGYFTNGVVDSIPYTDENSQLLFKDLKGSYEGLPISSRLVTISNLKNPFLKCDLKSEANLSSLNSVLGSASFDFISGQMNADVTYEGGLTSDTSISLNGYLDIANGMMIYQPRNIKLENINGRLQFDSGDVLIRNLHAEAQSNKVEIQASIKNMVNLLMKDQSKLIVNAEIATPSLDLYAFKTMLGARKKKSINTKGKFARIAEKIDRFMDDCSIDSRIRASKLKYQKFNATNLDASISMSANKWLLQKVVLNNSDGSISMNGTLAAIGENNNAADLKVDLTKVDITKLFNSFDNFGLSSLRAENIKGRLTSKATLHCILDDETRLIAPSLSGNMDLSLQNGELINFDPLQKMAVFVLKKKDFSRVEFAELKNTFEIHGKMLTIHKMEIQSNVLGLFVEGLYDLEGKNTDLVIQVPLKYLKKREPGYVPENQGLDSKKGISVFVRAKNAENGEIDFKYGLFKKKSALEKAGKVD